jgi:tRNA A-37 threonylcarbamoyl transferase component Bud32
MKTGYEVYCLADPAFYDSPTEAANEDADFELARGPVPEGWTRSHLDDWIVYRPDQSILPTQGWKIHASACLDNAERILEVVWGYCVPKGITFKFIRSPDHLFIRNVKHADRGSSGKFVTIYPADETELAVVLEELGDLLDGEAGPYILSDLRWGSGPLYVRYGGFGERYCVGANGEHELAIEDAGGELVPDRRGPAFATPDWVTLPECLGPHLAARNEATVDSMPYEVERALAFSNGGGVYVAVDERTGDRVVLKEARPNAGLAMDGAEAVSRLHREREMLKLLSGTGVVPEVRDHFTLGEHHFLVQEFIEGEQLSRLFVQRYPLTSRRTDAAAAAEYTRWALGICAGVERGVEAAHERGVVLGDLHPSNVLVRADDSIVLIDLEGGWRLGEERHQTLAAPGFVAPAALEDFEIDRYALACLRIHMFMPLTSLIDVAPDKVEGLAEAVERRFPVPAEFVAEAARVITRSGATVNPTVGGRPNRLDATPAGWREARDSMARAIVSSATPERDDRLYPGDIQQFVSGGLNLAHGAAGVLYALAKTGADYPPEHEEWLVERALNPEPGTPPGFYKGLHGVAYVLDQLGRRGEALRVLEMCQADIGGKWERLGLDLVTGLAGVGLNLAHFAETTGEASLREAASQVANVVAERLGDEDSVGEVSGSEHPHAGLTRGSSGPALFFLRLYEQRGDSNLLDLAATALRQDLRRCTRSEDDSLEVNEGWRTMPYLADGSVGIGIVLDEYLVHRDDERFAEAASAIRRAAEAEFYIEPGLFWGRAGMVLYHGHSHAPGRGAEDPIVAEQIRRLVWHALTYKGHLAFPGEQLLRLSMDLATGTAGVLLGLGAALHDEPVHLPFLPSLASKREEPVDEDLDRVPVPLLTTEGR